MQTKETISPLFFYMSLRLKLENLLSEILDENPSLFLIELNIGIDNSINIILDGDNGVTLSDCIKISRKMILNTSNLNTVLSKNMLIIS